MKNYRDTVSGEVMSYDAIKLMFLIIKREEPLVWDEEDTVEDFINFHIMCGDIEEVK